MTQSMLLQRKAGELVRAGWPALNVQVVLVSGTQEVVPRKPLDYGQTSVSWPVRATTVNGYKIIVGNEAEIVSIGPIAAVVGGDEMVIDLHFSRRSWL